MTSYSWWEGKNGIPDRKCMYVRIFIAGCIPWLGERLNRWEMLTYALSACITLHTMCSTQCTDKMEWSPLLAGNIRRFDPILALYRLVQWMKCSVLLKRQHRSFCPVCGTECSFSETLVAVKFEKEDYWCFLLVAKTVNSFLADHLYYK